MIRAFAFNAQGSEEVTDFDRISDLIETGTVVWGDMLHATPDELALIEEELNLHPLAVEDASKHGQRPKLEFYEGHAYIVAYAATRNGSARDELSEVDIFIGPNWLLTVHEERPSGAHFDLQAVRERCGRMDERQETNVAFLLYTVLDEIVDAYFGTIEEIGDLIDDIEERIFAEENPERDEFKVQQQMLEVRKMLLHVRRKIVPLREVLLSLLRDDLPYIGSSARHYFQDVLDHVMRLTDEIDNRRELIGNTVDAHLAMANNQMNQTMKRMTSWGAILIVSTLITGIFGMNFTEMDLIHTPNAFRAVLVLMLCITLGLYLYFKRKGWI